MPARLFAIVCLSVLSLSLVAPQNAPSYSSSVPLLYTVAPEYNPLAWIRGEERFPRGATIFIHDEKGGKPLLPKFFATADTNVSFDGKNVLFAGKKKPQDRWQIWEVSASTGNLRQITQCAGDCVRPLYVPPDRFVYAEQSAGKFILKIAPLSASEKPSQLTHVSGNFLPADILQDGRILFEASYPLGDNVSPELYTVYTDGSGVEAYRCDHAHARYAGKQLPSSDIVFSRDGNLFRFTSALAHEVAIAAPAGAYAGDVVETPDSAWLLSWHAANQTHFELRKWKPGAAALQPEVVESSANLIQPALLTARRIPNIHPSGLHEWKYANVLCLNAYTSKYSFVDGSIASVRLYTRDAWGAPRLLGTAQVEKDGSFYLRVPGDQPLKIEVADSSGNTLKKEAGWFWMRAGEQRVCVGCHAGPETAPENAVPAVLLRSTIPADMTGGVQRAAAGGH